MNPELFASYIGIPVEDVAQFLSLNQHDIYQFASYRQLVQTIDRDLLDSALAEVRALYDEHLPALVDYLRDEHHHAGRAMSALTLGNWTLGFLHNSEDLERLPSMHHRVSMPVLMAGLPPVLDILSHIRDTNARHEWQRAMALLSLPLFCVTA
ncbi:MAG: hypothetical protein U0670_03595 [Anaerolineae bacterium]